MKRILALIVSLAFISGCKENVSSRKPDEERGSTQTTLGKYKITYLGDITVNFNRSEVIEVYDTQTEQTILMIRGFGASNSWGGKHNKED